MNPAQLTEQVREYISRLDDEHLLRVLDAPDGEYTPEALAFARAELEMRGGHVQVAERVPDYSPGSTSANGTDLRLKHGGGIAGWLILPAIGLVFALTTASIQALSSSAGFLKAPGIEEGLELVFVFLWLLFVIIVAYLFLAKHRWAPYVYSAFLVANLAIFGLYYLAHMMAAPDTEDAPKELARALVSCVVWIPYFLTSKRVRLTFVR